jgi:hypothetical protein
MDQSVKNKSRTFPKAERPNDSLGIESLTALSRPVRP